MKFCVIKVLTEYMNDPLVCIVVLRRPQMRHNSTNVFLLALATFDAVLIVTSVLMKGYGERPILKAT